MPLRDRRSRFADLVLDIIDAYSRHRTGRNASLLAYMGILTVFPLLLGATTVLGLVLEGNESCRTRSSIRRSARSRWSARRCSENQGQISGSWWALVIGLGAALWGSLRAFLALQTALDDIWEVEHRPRQLRDATGAGADRDRRDRRRPGRRGRAGGAGRPRRAAAHEPVPAHARRPGAQRRRGRIDVPLPDVAPT